MPTLHITQISSDKIDEKIIKLITEHQVIVKRTDVIDAALIKGLDNVTIDDVLPKACNIKHRDS